MLGWWHWRALFVWNAALTAVLLLRTLPTQPQPPQQPPRPPAAEALHLDSRQQLLHLHLPSTSAAASSSSSASRVGFYAVINLARRTDKLRCVAVQFAKATIDVRLIDGVDMQDVRLEQLGGLLPEPVQRHLRRHPAQLGHAGCLLGHARFFLDALAHDASAMSSSSSSSSSSVFVVFEDDIALAPTFAHQLAELIELASEAGSAEESTFDVLLLNWYCNEEHWKECARNNATADAVPESGGKLVRVRWFMSGGAYAITARGARKLLASLPCTPDPLRRHAPCSMAIDWHISSLIEGGKGEGEGAGEGGLVVYGAMPPIVTMAAQGANQRYGLAALDRVTFAATGGLCGAPYRSDTERGTLDAASRAPPPAVAALQVELYRFHREDQRSGEEDEKNPSECAPTLSEPTFRVVSQRATWGAAKAACEAEGWVLADVRSAAENARLARMTQLRCGARPPLHRRPKRASNGWGACAWIGLNASSGAWASGWQQQSTSNESAADAAAAAAASSFWFPGEPNNASARGEDATALCWGIGGLWNDFDAQSSLHCFVCQTTR